MALNIPAERAAFCVFPAVESHGSPPLVPSCSVAKEKH